MNEKVSMADRQLNTSDMGSRDDIFVSIDRRGFLLGGAAAIAGLTSLGGSAAASAPAVALADYSLSVGYWVGSDQIVQSESPESAVTAEMIIAASAVSPDRELLNSRGATVRIHGLFGASVDSGTQRLDVVAQYSSNTPTGTSPVYVWSHQAVPITQSSPSAMFAMPMSSVDGIALSLDRAAKAVLSGGSLTSTSSIGALAARATGVYFIALNASPAPVWSSYVFNTANRVSGGVRTLLKRSLGGLQKVSFPYLMVSVGPVGIELPKSY